MLTINEAKNRNVLRAASICLLAAAAGGSYWAARLLAAEISFSMDTPASVQLATHMVPEKADYYARLAQLDPERAASHYEAALRRNPRQYFWRIDLATSQELAGDTAAAEKTLLTGVKLSRYYLPRFSLASFYFRQERVSEFRRWAREALEISFADAAPIFTMARAFKIADHDLGSEIVPDRARPLSYWLDDLVSRRQLTDVPEAARRLIAAGSEAYRAPVLRACEQLFAAGQVATAVDLWNEMAKQQWISYRSLDAAAPITNPKFETAPLSPAGFDWLIRSPAGVTVSFSADGLRVEFNGKEPEQFVILSQNLYLQPDVDYDVITRYNTQGLGRASGLRWSVAPVAGGSPLTTSPFLFQADEGGSTRFFFRSGHTSNPLQLILSYARVPGTTRADGVLVIEEVQAKAIR